MAAGRVKLYLPERSIIFIAPDDGTSDLSVAWTEFMKSGLGALVAGQQILYDVSKDSKGRPSAINLCKP